MHTLLREAQDRRLSRRPAACGTRPLSARAELEPLFRCNLACAGCGKIDHPDILHQRLRVEECLAAVDECGAPWSRSPAASRCIHEEMPRSSRNRQAQEIRLPVHQCAAAREEDRSVQAVALPFLGASRRTQGGHDRSVCHEGVFEKAISAIKAQGKRLQGQRNMHVLRRDDAKSIRAVLDFAQRPRSRHVDSPGYAYERAPDQAHFLGSAYDKQMFREVFAAGKGKSGDFMPALFSISSPAKSTSGARRGAFRPTPCSAGSVLAICSARAMRRRTRS